MQLPWHAHAGDVLLHGQAVERLLALDARHACELTNSIPPIRITEVGLPLRDSGRHGESWNICVADAKQKNRWVAVTLDGASNKEPDWVPVWTGAKK